MTRPTRLAALVLTIAALGCASARSRALSETMPLGVPSAATRASWERIDGDYETATDHVRYALFVDPERPLLFRLTQYRVTPRKRAAGRAREDGAETVIWNATPEKKGPLRCFMEEPVARARPRGQSATWRDVDPDSDEFRANMGRAIEIYIRVRADGKAGPPVG